MANSISIDSSLVLEALAALKTKAENMGPVFDDVGQMMETRLSNRFETLTDPNGRAWMGWADSTIKSYPDDGNKTILDRYGDLLQNITHEHDETSVTYGFGEPYAAYHEYGTDRMPRRGLMMDDPEAGTLSASDQASVLELISGFFSK